jgi:hypothetical protein
MDAEKFARDAYSHPGGVSNFLELNQGLLNRQLAADLEKIAKESVQAGISQKASAIASLAMAAYLELGDRAKALDCLYIRYTARFAEASTVEQYQELRADIMGHVAQAVTFGDAARPFRINCLGIAVQCGYFAAEAPSSRGHSQQDLVAESLRDMKELLAAQPPALDANDVKTFMANSYATLDLATARYWGSNDSGISVLLDELAAGINERVPEDAVLSDDPGQDAGMAEVLARLAARHGTQ